MNILNLGNFILYKGASTLNFNRGPFIQNIVIFNDAAELENFNSDIPLERIRERFSYGDKCFAYIMNFKIVAVIMLCNKSCFIHGLNFYLHLNNQTAYIYWIEVDRKYLRKQIFKNLFNFLSNFCRENGIENIYAFVNNDNLIMHNFLSKNGFIKIMRWFFLKVTRRIIFSWAIFFDNRFILLKSYQKIKTENII